jgi:hypothetical protein
MSIDSLKWNLGACCPNCSSTYALHDRVVGVDASVLLQQFASVHAVEVMTSRDYSNVVTGVKPRLRRFM